MRPRKKSPHRNVRPQRQPNSRDARSQPSARKKSSGLKKEIEMLRVATPSDNRSEWLRQEGLIVPDDLDPSQERIPLDFTTLSNQAVGALHSRFAVRHAHALYRRALLAGDILSFHRRRRLLLARFRALHVKEYKTARELEGAFSTGRGRKVEETIMALEIKAEVLDAVIGGYDDIMKAASREMSRRDSERAPRD